MHQATPTQVDPIRRPILCKQIQVAAVNGSLYSIKPITAGYRVCVALCSAHGRDAPDNASRSADKPKSLKQTKQERGKTSSPSILPHGWWTRGRRSFDTNEAVQDPWASLIKTASPPAEPQPAYPKPDQLADIPARAASTSKPGHGELGSGDAVDTRVLTQTGLDTNSDESSQQQPHPQSIVSRNLASADATPASRPQDERKALESSLALLMAHADEPRKPVGLQDMPDIWAPVKRGRRPAVPQHSTQQPQDARRASTQALPPGQMHGAALLDELHTSLHSLSVLLSYQDADTQHTTAHGVRDASSTPAGSSAWFTVSRGIDVPGSTQVGPPPGLPPLRAPASNPYSDPRLLQFRGGLASAAERVRLLDVWWDVAAEMELLGVDQARQGKPVQVAGLQQAPGQRKGAQQTVAEVVSQLQVTHPQLFSPPDVDSQSPDQQSATRQQGHVQPAKQKFSLAAVRTGVQQVVEQHGLDANPQLVQGIVQLAADSNVSPRPATGPAVHPPACAYLDSWLVGARQLEQQEPGLVLVQALRDHHHLLLNSTRQIQESLAALKVLLGPTVGPQAVQLASREPHLMYKSPQQLEQDLEDLLDITHLTPARLVTAIEQEPALLAHHDAKQLLSSWSLLTTCVTSSLVWRSELPLLLGQDLATALLASHIEIDGLQYLIDRQQDHQMSLAQALQTVSQQGLGRKYRRWKQRHVLLSEWQLVRHPPPTPNAVASANKRSLAGLTKLSQATVVAFLEARAQEASLGQVQVQEALRQQQVLRTSLSIVMQDIQGSQSPQ